MKILVTGGAGFIGSHLCRYLLEKGNKVICVDNFLTGKKENIQELLKNDQFDFIEHDINDPIDLEIEQIYNLACPASPIHYQANPVLTTKTNVLGTINMLELAKKYNARILQASTSEVYGDPLVHPQDESYWGNSNPLGVRGCYDEGKRCAETLFMDYYRQHDLDIKIVRIFNTYGPTMYIDDGRVVSNFIVQALKNEEVTIYGCGNQTRCFQYVDDLINGLVKMMEADNFIGPVNLGNPKEITIKELAETIIKMINSDSKIVYETLPEDDPKKRKPVIELASEKLNWQPKISLNDGLKGTIEYFETIVR